LSETASAARRAGEHQLHRLSRTQSQKALSSKVRQQKPDSKYVPNVGGLAFQPKKLETSFRKTNEQRTNTLFAAKNKTTTANTIEVALLR